MPGGGKRKRKGLIWAHDGDGAEKHPAYLLDADDGAGAPGGDANGMAWIEWASNGAVVQIPKSRIASPLASRRGRTAGRVAKNKVGGAPAQSTEGWATKRPSNDTSEAKVHLPDGGVGHASKSAVPSPVASAVMGKIGDSCYDYDTDNAPGAPSPVVSKDVHVKLEGALGYATDEEPVAAHKCQLQTAPGGVPRPSPVRSATVKTEKVYAEDTDEEEEGRSAGGSAKPSPVASIRVKQEKEFGYETDEDDVGRVSFESSSSMEENAGAYSPLSRTDFIQRMCDFECGQGTMSLQAQAQGNWICLESREREFFFTWDDERETKETDETRVWWVNERTGKFIMIPQQIYDFWSPIYECKTWGDVKNTYDRGFYELLVELYAARSSVDKAELEGKQIEDHEPFDMKALNPRKHQPGIHDMFPPCIEQLQLISDSSGDCGCMTEGPRTGRFLNGCLYYEASAKDEVLGLCEEYEDFHLELKYEPGLARFYSMASDGVVEKIGSSERGNPVPMSEIFDNKSNKSDWASAVVYYSHDRFRPDPSDFDDGQPFTLTNLPGEVMGEILGYLAYDANNLPTMRALNLTCKTFNNLFDYDDYTCELMLPNHFLVPHQDTSDDNAGKLNLWEGELDDIKCGNGDNQLGSWRDMNKGSDNVKEFVWYSGYKFLCLPKNTYTFWSTIKECKTWGDIRMRYTRGFYQALMSMYWEHSDESLPGWNAGPLPRRLRNGGSRSPRLFGDLLVRNWPRDKPGLFQGRRFLDTKVFDVSQLLNASNMTFGEEDNIPPFIEFIQSSSLPVHCRDILKPFGNMVTGFHGDEHLHFERNEEDGILAAIKKSGAMAQYEPGLSQFMTMYT